MLEGNSSIITQLKHPKFSGAFFVRRFMNYVAFVLGLFGLCLGYGLTITFVSKNRPVPKALHVIFLTAIIGYTITLLVLLPASKSKYEPLSKVGMYLTTFIFVGVLAVLTIVFGKKKSLANPTKSLAFAGVSIALAFALSYVKLFSLPQGGSVTLASMLPIIIYSYIFGAKKGIMCGIIYGALQFIQSPQVYQPMQILVDYPIAFGSLGIAGIVREFKSVKSPVVKFILGGIFAGVARYISHFISGYFVFSSWAMPGYSALTWSLVYNLYVFVDVAICIVAGSIAFSYKGLPKLFDKLNPEE